MITNHPYRVLSSWNDSFHFCDWGGVSCGKRHKRVTRVGLISKGLEGSLSPHVGNLTFLREFLLFNNSFEGTIADWRCWNLVLATFKECYLARSIGNLSYRLCSLHLEFNRLHGYVPSSIGNLVGLTTLHLSFNRFIGKIPSTIGRLKNLQLATFVENQFSGQIPDEIGNLTLMTKLALDFKQVRRPHSIKPWESASSNWVGSF
ncbi:putative non-specific serine/threonine protein kinase [Helianthus anomalus]